MLSTIEVELKLIIAGNHDISLDYTHKQNRNFDGYQIDDDEHEQALEIMKGPLAREVGLYCVAVKGNQ